MATTPISRIKKLTEKTRITLNTANSVQKKHAPITKPNRQKSQSQQK